MNLLLLLLSLIAIDQTSPTASENIIPWSTSRKLVWADFKASPDGTSSNAALTNAKIVFNYGHNGKILKFNVRCGFDKNKSWARIKNDYILEHEQKHFDIAELYARKLYKALTEYQFKEKTVDKDLNAIYQKVMQEHFTTQAEYDSQTDHSLKQEEQKKWDEKIEQELKNTKAFANYQ